jgi:2-polyprenyl-6-hydroxyphenyl methylase / 3-demethylubiquinone-9 3-methyltransferase
MTTPIQTHPGVSGLKCSPEPDGFHIRAATFHPVRTGYARRVILEQLGWHPRVRSALVVGAGRGLLARELARLGLSVDAIDPDPDAIRLAREATARENLSVDYRVGDAHRLPYPDAAFDVLYYADTFEITPDLDRVLAEAARVLRPEGALLYDTVARTRLSRLIYLGALQSWRWSRFVPPNRYAWDRLRPPEELLAKLADHGLRNRDVTAFLPANPLRLLRAILRARRGDLSDPELAGLAGMHFAPPGTRPEVTYLGFAIKGG